MTAKEYRAWKKSIEVSRKFHDLDDSETALLTYSHCEGEAKDLIDIMEDEDLIAPGGLAMLWQLLDGHDQLQHERTGDAYFHWETAARKPGQPMDYWTTSLRRLRLELEAQDPEAAISDRQLASKMIKRSGLTKEQCAQVLFNSGGKYVSKRVETVLRVTYPDIGTTERRLGLVHPPRLPPGARPQKRFNRFEPRPRASGTRTSSRTSSSSSTNPRRMRTYTGEIVEEEQYQDNEDDEDQEEEDLAVVPGEDPAQEIFEGHEPGDSTPEGDLEGSENSSVGADDALSVSELQEAFAAGWRAKKQDSRTAQETRTRSTSA